MLTEAPFTNFTEVGAEVANIGVICKRGTIGDAKGRGTMWMADGAHFCQYGWLPGEWPMWMAELVHV